MTERTERATVALRVGHLIRIGSYLDMAILSMWTRNPRALVLMGMAEASVRGAGPGGEDEKLLRKLRDLVAEAREYYAADDFPAAMARMRVADDLVVLHTIRLGGGADAG
jgi:hypothetical protein